MGLFRTIVNVPQPHITVEAPSGPTLGDLHEINREADARARSQLVECSTTDRDNTFHGNAEKLLGSGVPGMDVLFAGGK